MVYHLGIARTEGRGISFEALDGDVSNVRLIDDTPDEGGKPLVHKGGRALDPRNVPTKVLWQDPDRRPIPDVSGGPLVNVSNRARLLIEEIEPGVHQFLPVQFLNADRQPIQDRWFLVCCNRIDSFDWGSAKGYLMRTFPGGAKGWVLFSDLMRFGRRDLVPADYDTEQPPEIKFSQEKTKGFHLWVDKHFSLNRGIWVSDDFDRAWGAAELTGRELNRKWRRPV